MQLGEQVPKARGRGLGTHVPRGDGPGGPAHGGGEAEPYQNAQAGELSERLRTALGRLPQRQAEVFALHALEGWKHDEIARQMQITCDAVGVLLHRARARLRELLAPVMKMESRKVAS